MKNGMSPPRYLCATHLCKVVRIHGCTNTRERIYRCVLQIVTVCCNVLQCVASVYTCWTLPWDYVAMFCSELRCVVMCCSVLQRVAVGCCVLLCVSMCCSVLQQHATHQKSVAVCCCSVLQCIAVYCSVLQCVAVCCVVCECRTKYRECDCAPQPPSPPTPTQNKSHIRTTQPPTLALQQTATHRNTQQQTATRCNALENTRTFAAHKQQQAQRD